MEVSVVIPVYNAEAFVGEAVESALEQPEVTEVVLVEDGSPDGSYEVCKELARKHQNVALYTHPNRENRGPGATRNRAIRESSNDFIAFLDADDFFLPDRFERTAEVFERHPDADGVYEAIGTYFESEEARKNWSRGENLTTIRKRVPPSELFYEQQVSGGIGWAHLNGMTVRRGLLDRVGYFSEDLMLHQDIDLFIKMIICGNLYPGKLEEPVAIRRVHDDNRVSEKRSSRDKFNKKIMMWISVIRWAMKNGFYRECLCLKKNMLNECRQIMYYRKPDRRWVLSPIIQHIIAAYKIPEILLERHFYKSVIDSLIGRALRKIF